MLPIPARLFELVAAGLWPRDEAQEQRQHLRPLVSAERVRRVAPEERMIYLQRPPFHTLAEEMGDPISEFWTKYGSLHQLRPERAMVLGDFGLGSDTAIVLYYGEDDAPPSVLRLKWSATVGEKKTDWVLVADTFDAFADMLAGE